MSGKVIFKYFEGYDADHFNFYRVPKQLFTDSYFKGLSSDAKILYGLMLDRISLSVKNRWLDEENRAYIYFSIEEVMEMLDCGKNKAIKCMKELDEETGIGLIRKRRRGFGKSNMIYVKTFQVEYREEVEPSKAKPECETEQVPEEFDNQTNRETDPVTQVYDVNHVRFNDQITGSPQSKLHEVCFQDTNNTNYNKTEYSDLKSYRILSGDAMSTGTGNDDAIRYGPFQTDKDHILPAGTTAMTEKVYDLVRLNIDLEGLLLAREHDRDLILEIYSLIVEMLSCRSEEILISSSRYPAEIVRSRFIKLRYDHILYVIDCLEKNTNKVKNIRKYLLAALFNAPATIDGYYRTEVRHDMAANVYGST